MTNPTNWQTHAPSTPRREKKISNPLICRTDRHPHRGGEGPSRATHASYRPGGSQKIDLVKECRHTLSATAHASNSGWSIAFVVSRFTVLTGTWSPSTYSCRKIKEREIHAHVSRACNRASDWTVEHFDDAGFSLTPPLPARTRLAVSLSRAGQPIAVLRRAAATENTALVSRAPPRASVVVAPPGGLSLSLPPLLSFRSFCSFKC